MIEQIISYLDAASAPISQALIHSLWLGGLIAAILAIGLIFLKGSDPRLRYLLACLAMILTVALTLATGSYLVLKNDPASAAVSNSRPEPAATIYESVPGTGNTIIDVDSRPTVASEKAWSLKSIQNRFFPVWIVGILIMSAYHLAGWRRIKGFVLKRTVDITDDWHGRVMRLCQSLNIHRPVRIMKSSWARVPCVVGWVRPVILMPVSVLSGLTVADLEMILAHELAHIRRHDILMGYIQIAIETILFFNPAIWWISRQIRIEREHCCDDVAIGLSGDRIRYARALTNLEELRGSRSSLAMAASGSLLHRVRRLAGVTSSPYRFSAVSAITVFLLTAALVLGLGVTGDSMPKDIGGPNQGMVENYQPGEDDIKGDWEIRTVRDRIQFMLHFKHDWHYGFTIKPGDISPEITAVTTYFELRRDAGTFHFMGKFGNDGGGLWGDGDCYFEADPKYVEVMAKYGFHLKDSQEVLKFAMHEITLDYVKGLTEAGYTDLSKDELLTAHIHDVTPEYITALDELGYQHLDMEELVEMKIHDVEPETIREYQNLGYKNLSQSDLVNMQIHDVDPEYIAELNDLGYKDLDSDELVEMKIHDVEPEVIRKYKELGYRDLDESELVNMQIHDVDPEYIAELSDLGYNDLNSDELVEMQIHDVEPEVIRDYQELGYKDLSESQLVSMQIHDVEPIFIKELQDLGYHDLDCEELVNMKIHDVEPSFIREMADLGYENIDPETLVSLQIHDVTPRFVRQLKELGYDRVSLSDLISMQIHDVTASYIRRQQRRGYDNLTVEELIDRKIHDE